VFTLKELHNLGLAELKIKKIETLNLIEYEVEIKSLNKEKLLVKLKALIPAGFDYLISDKNVEFKPMRKIDPDVEKRFGLFPVFKCKGEFCLLKYKDKGVFRIHPYYTNLIVSKNGILGDYNKGKFITIPKPKNTKMQYPIANWDYKRYAVHRLVAETWIENGDYVKKYIVDHINRNKLDFRAENLRWVSQTVNSGRHSSNNEFNIDYRYVAYCVNTGKKYQFISLKDLGDFFKVDYRILYSKQLPFYMESNGQDFIIEDLNKFTNWSLLKNIEKYKYKYKVTTLENDIMYFKSWRDIAKRFGISVNSIVTVGGNLFEVLKERLRIEGIKAEAIGKYQVYNQYSSKYDIEAKDLETGETITASSTKLLGEKLGTNKSNIIPRLNNNKKEGLPLEINGKRYLIRRTDKPFPKIKEKINKPKRILHIPSGIIFNSLREVERKGIRSRSYVSQCLANPNCEEFKPIY